jgi:CRISPR-associated protein Csb2
VIKLHKPDRIALYTLSGVRPRSTDVLRVGEVMHAAAVTISTESSVTGQTEDRQARRDHHRHMFVHALDINGDGRLDVVCLHAQEGLPTDFRKRGESLNRLWYDPQVLAWDICLAGVWSEPDELALFPVRLLFERSASWVSVTPYYHPWYNKKGFGYAEQIARECATRGLPAPNVVRLSTLSVGGEPVTPAAFRSARSRGTGNPRQPDVRGAFFRLVFPQPIQGPLALGYACHFGMGMFVPQLVADVTTDP